jgi:hypothetical protein
VTVAFDPEQMAFLESGCALIVAAVSADGVPLATRGWGLDVQGPATVRLLLDADEVVLLDDLRSRGRVAVTACNVPTYRSMQLKGTCEQIEDATDTDVERAGRFCDDFFDDILEVDGTPRWKCERIVPTRFVVARVVVAEVFDQTPGPTAGSTMDGSNP